MAHRRDVSAAAAARCLPSQDMSILLYQLHGRLMEARSPRHLMTILRACGAAAAAAAAGCLHTHGMVIMSIQLRGLLMERRSPLHLMTERHACGVAALAARCSHSRGSVTKRVFLLLCSDRILRWARYVTPTLSRRWASDVYLWWATLRNAHPSIQWALRNAHSRHTVGVTV